MLELFTIAVTLASSFMVADTVTHVVKLQPESVSTVFFGFWLTTLALFVFDSNWFNFLGFVHVLVFLACSLLAYQHDSKKWLSKDYIRIPLMWFFPTFLILYGLSD